MVQYSTLCLVQSHLWGGWGEEDDIRFQVRVVEGWQGGRLGGGTVMGASTGLYTGRVTRF